MPASSLDAIFAYADMNKKKTMGKKCWGDDEEEDILTVNIDQHRDGICSTVVDVVQSSRARAVVMVGLPSWGGDELIEMLKQSVLHNRIVPMSADDVFFKGGKYKFVGSKLPQAHTACKAKYFQAHMASPKNIAVVNNTNALIEDMDAYTKQPFVIVRFTSDDVATAVEVCARDTVRNLPRAVPERVWHLINMVEDSEYKTRFASTLKAVIKVRIS